MNRQATDFSEEPLDQIVAAVTDSARYRSICPDVVRRVAARELAVRKTRKEAEQQTRNRLHQIAGAYLERRPPYAQWLDSLRSAPDATAYRAELRRMMRCHQSTRERLPDLDRFYLQALNSVRPIRSVIDLACGFNTLALPWMGLEPDASYRGSDLYSDMTDFLGAAMQSPFAPLTDVEMATCDLEEGPPQCEADIALVLKFLPLLDRPGEMLAWLRRLRTRYALVSFPSRTLGGRNVGMVSHYRARFSELLQTAGWNAETFSFESELCFLVEIGNAN